MEQNINPPLIGSACLCGPSLCDQFEVVLIWLHGGGMLDVETLASPRDSTRVAPCVPLWLRLGELVADTKTGSNAAAG